MPANQASGPKPSKKQVRILMLHGYTQSGPLFRAKTRSLEKLLTKHLQPLGLEPVLIYPTGPNRLRASDIPGYQPPEPPSSSGATISGTDDADSSDSWAWWRKDEASGSYRLLNEGMTSLAEQIRSATSTTSSGSAGDEDPASSGDSGESEAAATAAAAAAASAQPVIDGVLGFSQGGAMASLVAAALEFPHREIPSPSSMPSSSSTSSSSSSSPASTGPFSWLPLLRASNNNHPLKFAIIYSAFYPTPAELTWLFNPKLQTPTLHFIGSLDTVVDESRSRALVDKCEDPLVVVHPGGHYAPVSKEWVMPVAGFIKKVCYDSPRLS